MKTTANIDEYSEKVTQLEKKKTQRVCPTTLTDCPWAGGIHLTKY